MAMGLSTVSPAPYLLPLLICCSLATHSGDGICVSDGPTITGPSLRLGQGAQGEGLQVLVPSYNFSCNGLITSVTIGAAPNSGDGGFIFQIWRPQADGTCKLTHSVNTSTSVQRISDTLSFNTSIPVRARDMIGYRLEPGDDEMIFPLDQSNASQDVVIHTRTTSERACRFSLCNSSEDQIVRGSAPLISVQFEPRDDDSDDNEEGEEDLQCVPVDVPSCLAVADVPPSLSPPSSTTIPTPTDAPSATTTAATSSAPTEDEGSERETLLNLNLTKETIIVLAIGILLFIVLVLLVVILVACVCRKRKPTQYRFKSPPPGSIIGTPVTSIPLVTPSTRRANGAAARSGDMYINSAMQTPLVNGVRGNGAAVLDVSTDLLSPSNHHEVDNSHRGRRMKSPLLPESPRDPLPPIPLETHLRHVTRPSRDTPQSPTKAALLPPSSASSSVSPRSGSVPLSGLPATVPPPAAIALQHAALAISSMTADSHTPTSASHPRPSATTHSPPFSTTHPPPFSLSHPPHSSTCHTNHTSPRISQPAPSISVTTGSSESTKTHRATGTSELPMTDRRAGHPYDHLVSSGRFGADASTPVLKSRPDASSKLRSSMYVYTYVPTEEQRRLIKIHNTGRYETTEELDEVKGYDRLRFFKESETYWSPATTTSGLYAQLYENKYRELPREQIIIEGQIGSGHFGSVSKGVWQLCGEGGEVVDGIKVAVKVVKTEAEEVQRVKLLQEAAIMGQFAHPNVVRLNGVVTVGDPIMMVLEYMPQGDLKSYLQRMRPTVTKRPVPRDAPRLFVKFSKDIAGGMSYLVRKNFVHRDLATRNILLSHTFTCKIGDFGMARDIAGSGGGSDYYRSNGGIIPVKWTAPESLNYNKYTSASDVWSYGMVLFEIWSLGYKPFHELANPIVIALVTSKHCQAPPPGCPRPIYHLMVECWNPKDTQRPTFDCIQTYLDSPDDSLLQWSPSDTLPGKQAHILGAPLVEGNNLYIDLQRTYQNQLLAQIQSSNT